MQTRNNTSRQRPTTTGSWSRRRFLASVGAAWAGAAGPLWARGGLPPTGDAGPGTAMPEVEAEAVPPGVRWPLLDGGWARRNGTGRFNLPLYGPGGAVIEAGERPEARLRLQGVGGALWLGIESGTGARELRSLADVEVRLRAGRVVWVVRDEAVLGRGALAEVLITSAEDRPGLLLRVRGEGIAQGTRLLWAFAAENGLAASERRPANSAGGTWVLRERGAEVTGAGGRLRVEVPEGATVHVADGAGWQEGWARLGQEAPAGVTAPVLAGSCALGAEVVLVVTRLEEGEAGGVPVEAATVEQRLRRLDAVAETVRVETPDTDLNAALPSLLMAMESVWDEGAKSLVPEAGVAEASPGWRGPWALDALGQGERARAHFRTWMGRQNTEAVAAEQEVPVRGACDAGSRGVRKDAMLHTNGDVGHCGCDLNLLFFAGLLRHLRWTGDLALAREAWPALLRHMDWEYRLFRRPYGAAEAVQAVSAKAGGAKAAGALPLYESYGCVPETAGLGGVAAGSGGGSAFASAGNYFVNRGAAEVARLLNQDPVPFEEEARLIRVGMERWLAMGGGGYAEGRDLLGERTVFPAAGLWTAAALLDAELLSSRQAWGLAEERLGGAPGVPVEGAGVREGGWVLPTVEWAAQGVEMPAMGTAACGAMALGLWRAGRCEEAWGLLRGTVVDSMARGDRPGALGPRLSLEPWLPEPDAADVVGVMARAVVEGLFGVQPDLLRGSLVLRPGFPEGWSRAALRHPLVEVEWTLAEVEVVAGKGKGAPGQRSVRERWVVEQRWTGPVTLSLVLRARGVGEPEVLVNGKAVASFFDAEAVGCPRLLVPDVPAARRWEVEVRWTGAVPMAVPEMVTCGVGDEVPLPAGVSVAAVEDPQGCLEAGRVRWAGRHVVFATVGEATCRYSLPIRLVAVAAQPMQVADTGGAVTYEPVALGEALHGRVTEMLSRGYRGPRSPWCSLGVPEGLLEEPFVVDDAGLRGAGGELRVVGVPFRTPAGKDVANCRFVSMWEGDGRVMEQAVAGRGRALHVLLTGTSPARAMRTEHGRVEVRYTDGSVSRLVLRSPETWWPVERDWVLDDYLLRWPEGHAVPARVALKTGELRGLDLRSVKGRGGMVEGGAATALRLALDPAKEMEAVRVECTLYGVVLAVLGMTVERG